MSTAALSLGDVLRRASEHLGKTSETGRLDAELLLAHTLGRHRIELYTDFDRPLSSQELDAYREVVARRARHEPVAYILGEWGFRRLTLNVDRRALIPRPETEIVVERALLHLRGLDAPAVLDVGTGTGAIALAIADEHPGARVTAIDVSADALALARENAERTGLAIELLERDVAGGLPGGPYDLVVSNPPYVERSDLETLMPDVRDYEPHVALVGDGVPEVDRPRCARRAPRRRAPRARGRRRAGARHGGDARRARLRRRRHDPGSNGAGPGRRRPA